jgi:hypothetical protein
MPRPESYDGDGKKSVFTLVHVQIERGSMKDFVRASAIVSGSERSVFSAQMSMKWAGRGGKSCGRQTFLKFFLIHNEGETTFSQKNEKNGLAFSAKVGYNNTSF